ncbi:hypothetical protein CWO90_07480 [Bradyrhizobium sp. Leo121]|nr:hypothetical protein CWO90_07480 [Bradyrhizobium sp. Leo121]
MFEQDQQCGMALRLAFQFVALEYETLTCCPRKAARVRRGLAATQISPFLWLRLTEITLLVEG